MGKITQSMVTILALGSFAFAGGDIAPIEEPAIVIEAEDESGFYIGVGAAALSLRNDLSNEEFSALGIMFQAGYQFNKYVAVEGRYTRHLGDLEYERGNTINPNYEDYPADFTNAGIYLKPMYAFEDFSVYALLGYGEVTLTDIPYIGSEGSVDRAEDGFQWGLGGAYELTEQLSLFADYVRTYDDEGFDYRAQNADIVSDLWTVGLSYRF